MNTATFIESLANHPHLIPELARMMHRAWCGFAPWAELAVIEQGLRLANSGAPLPLPLGGRSKTDTFLWCGDAWPPR